MNGASSTLIGAKPLADYRRAGRAPGNRCGRRIHGAHILRASRRAQSVAAGLIVRPVRKRRPAPMTARADDMTAHPRIANLGVNGALRPTGKTNAPAPTAARPIQQRRLSRQQRTLQP